MPADCAEALTAFGLIYGASHPRAARGREDWSLAARAAMQLAKTAVEQDFPCVGGIYRTPTDPGGLEVDTVADYAWGLNAVGYAASQLLVKHLTDVTPHEQCAEQAAVACSEMLHCITMGLRTCRPADPVGYTAAACLLHLSPSLQCVFVITPLDRPFQPIW